MNFLSCAVQRGDHAPRISATFLAIALLQEDPHMPKPSHDDEDLEHSRALLDERICRLICPIASGMVGVCMTGIGVLHVAFTVHGRQTLADDLLAVDALTFLLATLSSYFALRALSRSRIHWLERVADGTFILSMVLLTMACFVITYSLGG
jgi:hypothetical protein